MLQPSDVRISETGAWVLVYLKILPQVILICSRNEKHCSAIICASERLSHLPRVTKLKVVESESWFV